MNVDSESEEYQLLQIVINANLPLLTFLHLDHKIDRIDPYLFEVSPCNDLSAMMNIQCLIVHIAI